MAASVTARAGVVVIHPGMPLSPTRWNPPRLWGHTVLGTALVPVASDSRCFSHVSRDSAFRQSTVRQQLMLSTLKTDTIGAMHLVQIGGIVKFANRVGGANEGWLFRRGMVPTQDVCI